MAQVRMSEAEVARDFPAVMRKLNGGAEIIIERGDAAVAVLRSVVPARRRISECIARLPANSTATIDPDFARDVQMAMASHRRSAGTSSVGQRLALRRRPTPPE